MSSWKRIPLEDLGSETKETELEALGHFVSRLHTGAKAKEWADRLAQLDAKFELEDLQVFLGSLAWRVRDYRQQYESEVVDIATRLREPGLCGWKTQQEAADEIERLRAQVADWERTVRLAEEALWPQHNQRL